METSELMIYNTLQGRELLEHRWYMSQKYNRFIEDLDVINDWIKNKNGDGLTHAERYNKAYFENRSEILKNCEMLCGRYCKFVYSCPLTTEELHKLLKD